MGMPDDHPCQKILLNCNRRIIMPDIAFAVGLLATPYSPLAHGPGVRTWLGYQLPWCPGNPYLGFTPY